MIRKNVMGVCGVLFGLVFLFFVFAHTTDAFIDPNLSECKKILSADAYYNSKGAFVEIRYKYNSETSPAITIPVLEVRIGIDWKQRDTCLYFDGSIYNGPVVTVPYDRAEREWKAVLYRTYSEYMEKKKGSFPNFNPVTPFYRGER